MEVIHSHQLGNKALPEPGRSASRPPVTVRRPASKAFARLACVWRTDADLRYFWPHYLGEKSETFDFLVELVDAGEKTSFFFVQVKATRRELTRSQTPARLRPNKGASVVCREKSRWPLFLSALYLLTA